MKIKFFSVMAIFLISFGFLGTNSIERLGASELSEKTMTQIVQEEQQNEYTQTKIACGGVCAYALGFFSSYLLGKLADYGNKKFCAKFKYSNWATKSYCNFMGY